MMMSKKEVGQALQNMDLGKNLDPEELDMLVSCNEVISFTDREVILQQGQKSKGLYFILSGNVLMTAKLLGESVIDIETFGPGNFLGEISYMEKVPCATTVIANQQVECLLFSTLYLDLISNCFPDTRHKIFYVIARQVCVRLKKMHDKIADQIFHTDMATRSFFSDFIQSLTKPEQITFEQSGIHIDQLKKIFLARSFEVEEVDELLKQAVLIRVAKECILIHASENTESCYVVIQGAVQSSIVKDNKIAKLSVIGPGILFASTSLIDELFIHAITFTACEKSLLFMLPKSVLDSIRNKNPRLWHKLFDLICHSLVALEKSMDKLDIRLQIEKYNR